MGAPAMAASAGGGVVVVIDYAAWRPRRRAGETTPLPPFRVVTP
jgi:hypothetical protein